MVVVTIQLGCENLFGGDRFMNMETQQGKRVNCNWLNGRDDNNNK